jgi:beta-glucosidase
MKNLILPLILLLLPLQVLPQTYKNPSAPIESRVKDLLGRMTPEEKFWQLFMIPGDLNIGQDKLKNGIFGFQVAAEGRTRDASQQMLNYAPGVSAAETAKKINDIQKFFVAETRLGIPIIPFDEALHGLVRRGATSFPQSIGLAASFDTVLMHRVAAAIAEECKTRGLRQILSPVINMATDVRWGRVEETYGEDPFLSAEMAVAYISEFENRGVVTTPKHLIANVGDGGRDSYPIHLYERYLREIHFPPFEEAIRKAGMRSVMTAYNSLDGRPCTANDWLLNTWLKHEAGFKGFVISDANAVGGANVLHMTSHSYAESGAQAITNGLDVIFQTSYDHYPLFIQPFLDGTIPPAVIDSAVARVLRVKFELGLFEHPYVDPKEAESANGNAAHRDLALQAARESIVLLKNDSHTLPVNGRIKTIAVIGQDAKEARLGGYSGPGNNKISILEGVRRKAESNSAEEGGGKKQEVLYAKGCSRLSPEFQPVAPSNLSHIENGQATPGLIGEYYSNIDFSGQPVFTRTDKQVRFQWTLFGPDPDRMPNEFYSVRWTGQLKSPGTGTWRIGIDGNDGYRLFIDGKLILDDWIKRSCRILTVPFDFTAGASYDIRIEYYEPDGNARFSLVWNFGMEPTWKEDIEEALATAEKADLAIITAGIEEGEFRDRASLALPGHQEELIRRIAATGKPVVIVLVGGSAITMTNWLDSVEAVVDVWYPGEVGGDAVADVLFGDYNPAGRLPVTFPVSEAQLPLVYNHKPTGRGDDYVNLTGQPLFPFGFGLSYTTFEYGQPVLDKKELKQGQSTRLHVTVTNTGGLDGDEVVQLYIRDLYASVARPVTELKGFQRISLKKGESRDVTFDITPEMLSMLDINLKKTVEPGDFRLMIGSSSKEIHCQTVVTVEGK